MVKIKRGNVVLKVKPEDVSRYFAMGYDVYGEDGVIVKKAAPSVVELQEQLTVAHAEIEALKLEIEKLKSSKKTSQSKKK